MSERTMADIFHLRLLRCAIILAFALDLRADLVTQISMGGEAESCLVGSIYFGCGPDLTFSGTQTGTTTATLSESVTSTYDNPSYPIVTTVSATGSALASYAALSASDVVTSFHNGPPYGSVEHGIAFATASLSDTLYFFSGIGSGYIEFTSHCITFDVETSCSLDGGGPAVQYTVLIPFQDGAPVALNEEITARAHLNEGTDGTFTLDPISVLDSNMQPVTSFLFWAQSGNPYPTNGGTFTPEPASFCLLVTGLGSTLLLRRNSRQRKRLRSLMRRGSA